MVKCGLKTQYLANEQLQNWFKGIFTLSLVPLSCIDTVYQALQNEMFQVLSKKKEIGKKGKDFLNYVVRTYFEGPFTPNLWNHFSTRDERTNNRVEGDNGKMKLACGAAKPNIDKAVALLKQFELGAQIKYANGKIPSARAPPQAPDIIRREAEFRKLRELYKAGKVTLKVYTDEILDIYRFEPKRKYIEELLDTDESDDEDAEDDGTDTSDEEDE